MNISFTLDGNLLNVSGEYLIETITRLDKNNYINGIEFLVNRCDNHVKTYLTKFASLCKRYNFKLNFKGIFLDLDLKEHIKFLEMYNSISNILEEKINITYSSCLSRSLETSISETISMYISLISYVTENKLNLNISIENLEYLNRPSIKDIITDILPNVYKLKLSYNIGHEALIGFCEYKLPVNNIIENITNIYLHDNDTIYAHLGFNYGNIDLYEVKDFINSNNYTNQITVELDFNKLKGNTIEEKLTAYVIEVNKVMLIIKH